MQGLQRGPAHSESEVQTEPRVRHDNSVNISTLSERSDASCQEAMKAPTQDSDRDRYSSDSAETEEDYEKKDETKVADPTPQGVSIFFSKIEFF